MQRKIATDKMQGKAKSKASTMLLISISLIIAIAGFFSILAINWRMKMHAREEAREKAISWQKLGSWRSWGRTKVESWRNWGRTKVERRHLWHGLQKKATFRR